VGEKKKIQHSRFNMTYGEIIHTNKLYYVSMRVLGLSIFITIILTALAILLPIGLTGRLTVDMSLYNTRLDHNLDHNLDHSSTRNNNDNHSLKDAMINQQMKWTDFQYSSLLYSENKQWLASFIDGQLMVCSTTDPLLNYHVMPTEAWSELTNQGLLQRKVLMGSQYFQNQNQNQDQITWTSGSEPPNFDLLNDLLWVKVTNEGLFQIMRQKINQTINQADITFQSPCFQNWLASSICEHATSYAINNNQSEWKYLYAHAPYPERIIGIPGSSVQLGLIWDHGQSYFQWSGPGWQWRYPHQVSALMFNVKNGRIALLKNRGELQVLDSVNWFEPYKNINIPKNTNIKWSIHAGNNTVPGGNLNQSEIQFILSDAETDVIYYTTRVNELII